MVNITVNLALQIFWTVFLYSDEDKLSVVGCTFSIYRHTEFEDYAIYILVCLVTINLNIGLSSSQVVFHLAVDISLLKAEAEMWFSSLN